MRDRRCSSDRALKAPKRKRVSVSPHSSPAKDPVVEFCRLAISKWAISAILSSGVAAPTFADFLPPSLALSV